MVHRDGMRCLQSVSDIIDYLDFLQLSESLFSEHGLERAVIHILAHFVKESLLIVDGAAALDDKRAGRNLLLSKICILCSLAQSVQLGLRFAGAVKRIFANLEVLVIEGGFMA